LSLVFIHSILAEKPFFEYAEKAQVMEKLSVCGTFKRIAKFTASLFYVA